MRWVIFLSLLIGAFAGYLFWFAEPVVAPPPPPPPPPVELSVGTLSLTLENWRVATSTEAAVIDVTLEDPGPRRTEVIALVERTLARYADMVDPAAMPQDELAWIRESGRPYTVTATGKASLGQGGRSSYRMQISYDTGGAHPNGTAVTESYGPEGERLSLEDVIGNDRALERLAAVVRPRLEAAIAARVSEDGGEPYEAGEDFDAGTAPLPENYQRWYLSDADLVVVFDPYQVGPYTLGTYEVAVPIAEISR
jgi:hypothetical protein